MDKTTLLRKMPAIDRLLREGETYPWFSDYPRRIWTAALRETVDELRQAICSDSSVDLTVNGILQSAKRKVEIQFHSGLRRVINGTGVVLHTNLGRAPLSERAVRRVNEIAGTYAALEYNVATGSRGERNAAVCRKLCDLTGAEDALVVNNNAGAVLLVLSALAVGREVIVSRGQLVEIGGGFRVPDVMRQSGATLVEVGTTNKTHVQDYERSINPATAAILKVHTSNFRIIGFTSVPDDTELTNLAHQHSLPLIDDLGSGLLIPLPGKVTEPTVGDRIRAGADVVAFSGDKLLGGCQAGIIAGRRQYLEPIRRHPLLRALRIDKLSLAALEGTLEDYLYGQPETEIPIQQMLRISPGELLSRARLLVAHLRGEPILANWNFDIMKVSSQAGGGSLPSQDFPGWGVTIEIPDTDTVSVEKFLRHQSVPIIGRITEGRLVIDVRCLLAGDAEEICAACVRIAQGG